MDVPPEYLLSLASVLALLGVVTLVRALRDVDRLSKYQEKELRALKAGRVASYGILAVAQAGLVAYQLCLAPGKQFVVADHVHSLCLLVSWAAHAVTLSVRWSDTGGARVLVNSLLALSAGAATLAADCLVVSHTSHQKSQDGGLDPEDAAVKEHMAIASVVVHSLLLVFLLILVVIDLVISGHVDAAVAARKLGVTAPLLGSEDHDTTELDAKALEEKLARKAEKAKNKPAKATRMGMARAAFKYVLPDTPGLRLRLLACFLLVAAERGVNLAVPILYKKLVEILSQVTMQNADKHPEFGAWVNKLLTAAVHIASGQQQGAFTSQTTAAVTQKHLTPDSDTHYLVMGQSSEEPRPATDSSMPAAGLLHDPAVLLRLAAMGLLAAVPFWNVFLPWVAAYLGCWYLKGGSGMEGLLSSSRDILWAPITQAAFRRVSKDVFGHLLDLDHSFHVKRKTGQIMRILDRGTTSIQDTVSIVLFNVLPQMADIVVACTYLAVATQPWEAAIVAVTVASYIPLTVWITERRGEVRKRMNALDNAREARATDMLLNYETVKLFCAESVELEGFDMATRQYQAAEYWQLCFLSLLAIAQGTTVWGGLVAGTVVCVKGVANGTLTVGDAVLFITMMNQLYVPLTYFGSYYRQVQKALIDVENMFELLATQPKVQDKPGAKPLAVVNGALALDNVWFGYGAAPSGLTNNPAGPAGRVVVSMTRVPEDGPYSPSPLLANAVLKGVSFSVPGGSTLAVVGSSGSGKSTLLKLLLRFYDPWSGAVLVDGQDISRATLASVRRAISVVPQDAVLFNQSIGYNIRYGVPDASDSEVAQAAQVAAIHDTIMHFKKGYATRVGERGLRLSGGEKQRVAFARAIIKKPAILVLDEATSALDSITEASIQRSLAQLRTSVTQVIVAHRLSTIKDADRILVMSQGQVVACDSHAVLIETCPVYAAMWNRQKDSMQDDSQALMDQVQEQEQEAQQQQQQQPVPVPVPTTTPPQQDEVTLPSVGQSNSAAGTPGTPSLITGLTNAVPIGSQVNGWASAAIQAPRPTSGLPIGSAPPYMAGSSLQYGSVPDHTTLDMTALERRSRRFSEYGSGFADVAARQLGFPRPSRITQPSDGGSSPTADDDLASPLDWSRHPTPRRSRAAHDHEEDADALAAAAEDSTERLQSRFGRTSRRVTSSNSLQGLGRSRSAHLPETTSRELSPELDAVDEVDEPNRSSLTAALKPPANTRQQDPPEGPPDSLV